MKREVGQRKVTLADSVQIPKKAVGTITFEMAHVDLSQKRLNKLEKLFNSTLEDVKKVLK
ncbi:MAG: hypothetical protein ACW97Z_12375 [Candidatus Hodarchaeales archaeon]|jgi:hypothetical protein